MNAKHPDTVALEKLAEEMSSTCPHFDYSPSWCDGGMVEKRQEWPPDYEVSLECSGDATDCWLRWARGEK